MLTPPVDEPRTAQRFDRADPGQRETIPRQGVGERRAARHATDAHAVVGQAREVRGRDRVPVAQPQRLVLRVRVEPLVEPTGFELVVRDEPVPELMAGLVDRHALRSLHRRAREHARAGREKRGILHPAGSTASPRGIDAGDVFVGVFAPPQAVEKERRARRLEVASSLRNVLGLQEHRHRHVAQPHLVLRAIERQRDTRDLVGEPCRPCGVVKRVLILHVVPIGGPREVVHERRSTIAFGTLAILRRRRRVAHGEATALTGGRPVLHARCARLLLVDGGQIELDIVRSEVREELGRRVELMAVPAISGLVDAELREPLRDEQEVVLVSRAATDARDLRFPAHASRDDGAGLRGLRIAHAEDGAVFLALIVGRDPFETLRRIGVVDRHGEDALPTPFVVTDGTTAQGSSGSHHVRRLRIRERIPIRVEPQVRHRVAALVRPAHDEFAVQSPTFLFVARPDRVIGATRLVIGVLRRQRNAEEHEREDAAHDQYDDCARRRGSRGRLRAKEARPNPRFGAQNPTARP